MSTVAPPGFARAPVRLDRAPTVAELGLALRRARKEKRLRQVDVAERANVSPLTVYRVEAGRMDASGTILFGLAVAVGLALFWRHLGRIVGGAMTP